VPRKPQPARCFAPVTIRALNHLLTREYFDNAPPRFRHETPPSFPQHNGKDRTMPLVKEIETLSRLRADGTLSDSEFRAAKQAILDEVPEAEPATDPYPASEAIALLSRCTLPPLLAGGFVYAMGIPATLSLTLGVTMLAAILIAEFRQIRG